MQPQHLEMFWAQGRALQSTSMAVGLTPGFGSGVSQEPFATNSERKTTSCAYEVMIIIVCLMSQEPCRDPVRERVNIPGDAG